MQQCDKKTYHNIINARDAIIRRIARNMQETVDGKEDYDNYDISDRGQKVKQEIQNSAINAFETIFGTTDNENLNFKCVIDTLRERKNVLRVELAENGRLTDEQKKELSIINSVKGFKDLER